MTTKLERILDSIKGVADRDERSELLIEFAERFQEVPEQVAKRPFQESHRVPGCESQAFVWAAPREDQGVNLYFAVENPQGISAKALAVILAEGLNGESLESLSSLREEIVYDIFGRGITMGRGHGLMSMVALVKAVPFVKLR